MAPRWSLRLTGLAGALACCGAAHAQPPASAPTQDMDMPSDLGAPLGPAAPIAAPVEGQALSVDLPIEQIASTPQGKATLERDLPGLCQRPEFPMFKTMSLRRLAGMSNGRISEAKLAELQADLTRAGPVDLSAAPTHGPFYPLVHTASYSVKYGGRQIRHFSHSIYHSVALVIASM